MAMAQPRKRRKTHERDPKEWVAPAMKLIEPQEIVFQDPPPRKGFSRAGSWVPVLEPLLKHPGKWALVYTFENPTNATSAQKNMHQRRVKLPMPDHEWGFSARGCELYAIYHGPKYPKQVQKRARRKPGETKQS